MLVYSLAQFGCYKGYNGGDKVKQDSRVAWPDLILPKDIMTTRSRD